MRKWPNLPPDVAAHVNRKIKEINWPELLPELMSGCSGCPARNDDVVREPDPCLSCPMHAVVWSAARLWAAAKAQESSSEVKAYYDSLEQNKGGESID